VIASTVPTTRESSNSPSLKKRKSASTIGSGVPAASSSARASASGCGS
jgi:hypothetical protein